MALERDSPPSYDEIMVTDRLNMGYTSIPGTQQQQSDEKSPELDQLLECHEKAIRDGINLRKIGITSEKLAKHYYITRKFQLALQYYEKLYTVRCTMYGFDRPLEQKAQVMDSIAFCFLNLHEPKEAEYWFSKASDMRGLTGVSEAAASSCHKKAREYEKKCLWEESLSYYQKEMETRERLTPSVDTEQKTIILHRIGVIYRKLCRFQDSLSSFHQAYDMAIRMHGTREKNKCVGACLSEIAHNYYKMENFSLAKQFWSQSLEEFVAVHKANPTHHIIIETYRNIGIACESAGEYKSAELNYREAWTTLKKRCVGNHKDGYLIKIGRDLFRVLKARGKDSAAIAIRQQISFNSWPDLRDRNC